MAMIQKYPEKEGKLLELFDKTWWPHQVICVRDGKKIRWGYQPSLAIVSCGNCWHFWALGLDVLLGWLCVY